MASVATPPKPWNEKIFSYEPGSECREKLQAELDKQLRHVESIPTVIGGQRFESGSQISIRAPHDHQHELARLHTVTKEQVQSAIQTSVATQRAWSDLPWEHRAAVFLKAADLLANKYRWKINAATMLGQGKSCFQAEIDAACELADFLRFNVSFARQIYQEQPMYSDHGLWNRVEVRGLEGFVFAIGPFNFTAISVNLAAAPALMGCGVLWKPAPQAALASWYMLEILEEAGLPPGVIQMVNGDPKMIGDLALASPDLSGIHFTGSTQTFDHIWSTVGSKIRDYKHYPRIVGETGGKDFVFMHEEADPQQVVTGLIRGAFEYQGQKCSAASRAYIPSSRWAELKPILVEQCASLKMGNPCDFNNFMGPVIDEKSFKKIQGYIDYAKESKDAEVICGGECLGDTGYFVQPTLVVTTNPKHKLMIEEIFGPVLTLYVYDADKLDETLELCDQSTPYALTGAIFAKNRQTIEMLSQKLKYSAGNFYINDKPTGAVVGQQPFGGSRRSGTNDKAGSALNLQRWVSHRTMKENFVTPVDHHYPHMG
ncbi:MAG: L-glutamate gamma-semialdehyde dehydrogenase [Oligoflexales bacterium]